MRVEILFRSRKEKGSDANEALVEVFGLEMSESEVDERELLVCRPRYNRHFHFLSLSSLLLPCIDAANDIHVYIFLSQGVFQKFILL